MQEAVFDLRIGRSDLAPDKNAKRRAAGIKRRIAIKSLAQNYMEFD